MDAASQRLSVRVRDAARKALSVMVSVLLNVAGRGTHSCMPTIGSDGSDTVVQVFVARRRPFRQVNVYNIYVCVR